MSNPIHPYYIHIEKNLHLLWERTLLMERRLEEKIQELEAANEQLRQKLSSVQPINIENINYKIQELTVQQLSGTLNIGMTALSDPDQIKKWLHHDEAAHDEAVDLNLHDIDDTKDGMD